MDIKKVAIGGITAAAGLAAWNSFKGGEIDLQEHAKPMDAGAVVRALGGMNDLVRNKGKFAEDGYTLMTPSNKVTLKFVGDIYTSPTPFHKASITYIGSPEKKEEYMDRVREKEVGLPESETHIFDPGMRVGSLYKLVSEDPNITPGWLVVNIDNRGFDKIHSSLTNDSKGGELSANYVGEFKIRDMSLYEIYKSTPTYLEESPGSLPVRSKDGLVELGCNLNKVPTFEILQVAEKN